MPPTALLHATTMTSPFVKNKFLLLACLLLAAAIGPAAYASRTRPSAPAKKSTTATSSMKGKRVERRSQQAGRGRRGKTPAIFGTPPSLPIEQPLSPEVIEYFGKGDIVHAARGLMLEPASEKSLYLLREAQRIGEAEQGTASSKEGAHQHYLSIGIANHNLYLFVKRHNVENVQYVRDALAAYAKARKAAPKAERPKIDILRSALFTSSGSGKRAQKLFAKVKPDLAHADFRWATYTATYYAAQHDLPNTMRALRAAYAEDPHATKGWLRVTDDFVGFKEETALQDLFREWKVFALPATTVKKSTPRHSQWLPPGMPPLLPGIERLPHHPPVACIRRNTRHLHSV